MKLCLVIDIILLSIIEGLNYLAKVSRRQLGPGEIQKVKSFQLELATRVIAVIGGEEKIAETVDQFSRVEVYVGELEI